MAAQTWIITDLSEGKYLDEIQIDRTRFPNAVSAGISVTKGTWRGGLADGVDEIRVNNGVFQFSILPTRGMGLWKGWLSGQTVGWRSPVRGPVHPRFVPLAEPSGLGWLDGFDEWVCRCGATSNGAPEFNAQGQLAYPLHGRLANTPAHYVEVSVDGDQIAVRGVVTESRFHFQNLELTTTIVTRLNQPGLEIYDEVTNRSASPGQMQMLYHCNFGAPLLGAGAEVVVPAETIVPRNDWAAEGVGHWSTYSAPTAGMPERVYFYRLYADADGQTQVLLKDGKAARAVTLQWNAQQLPCFSLWKNESAIEEGYVTGLEPGTNYPNPRSFEAKQGRVVELAPGASHRMQLAFTFHDTPAAVAQAEAAVQAVRADRPTRLFEKPQPEWCA